jgi:hypothetical protein
MNGGFTIRNSSGLQTGSGPILRRSCGCGGSCGSCQGQEEKKARRSLDRPGGARSSRDFSRMPATRSIDVRVGPADDAFEREADRVADAVTGVGAAPAVAASPAGRVQRQIDESAGGGEEAAADETAEETEADTAEEEDDDIADASGRPKLNSGASADGGMAQVPVGNSGGAPLPSSVRAPMESSIGHDFSSVRVHTGADAANATASVNARAFTVGPDIYFSPGRYEPSSQAGRHLLAHELTHVAQQGSGTARLQRAPGDKKKKAAATPPAPKAKAPKKKAAAKSEIKPCAKDPECTGCAKPSNEFAVHPDCGNETCGTSAALDTKLFIRHIDVNRKTQATTAIWGDSTKATHVSSFTTSPNPKKTPPGPFTIGEKCTACHTNRKGAGMGWFTGFHNGLEFGFHNSQSVGKGVFSHGCVRVAPCSCAKEIHDNTSSGTTTVCVHDGKPCKPLPKAGVKDKQLKCGALHKIHVAPPSGGTGGTKTPAKPAPAVSQGQPPADDTEVA